MFETILVVCVGNICRSPTGERLLQKYFPNKKIHSAGVKALIGHAADRVSSDVAQAHGLSLEGHVSKQLTSEMCRQADLILVMEKRHIAEVTKIAPSVRGKTMLFGHWLQETEVSDPYKLSLEAYQHVYTLLEKSALSWKEKL